MKCLKKRYLYILSFTIIICMAVFTGCSYKGNPTLKEDILSQKVVETNKIPITVLVKYAFTINGFEKAVEEKFPDIDIIQVGNYTSNLGIDEYYKRLENDDLTDIVMPWPIDVGEEFLSERLIDLSGYNFTGKYNISMLDDIAMDGKLYYLPGPSQVRGIVYNKTLFEENNWAVPKDFEEFIELCKTIEKSGIRSLQLGLKNSEVLDTAFIGYSLSDCYANPMHQNCVDEFNRGEIDFGKHFTPALETFQRLIDEGVLKKEDLNIDYSVRETMLFKRECAMVEDSALLTEIAHMSSDSQDEYALMPFFNPNGGEDWSRLYMVCYIGLNKNLEKTNNKDKLDKILEIMEYISTEEGQNALMSDTRAMYSSVIGVGAPDFPEIADLQNSLKNGRYLVFKPLDNAQDELRAGLAAMLKGESTIEDVIKMVNDGNTEQKPLTQSAEIYGKAEANFTYLETGNFITDVMKKETGSDIALFLDNGKDGRYNGKGLSGKIYKGDITSLDIGRIMPDFKNNETDLLCTVKITGENLINTLEHSIEVGNNQTGWFYYFSGLIMEYDVTAQSGNRIKTITDVNKKKIEPDKIYTVAIMEDIIPKEYITEQVKTGKYISDLLVNEIKEKGTISPSEDNRFIF